MLGVTEPPPDLNERTSFWINAFNLLCRGRPVGMSGIAYLPPLDILSMAEKLNWPCLPDECLAVITAMDDAYIDINNADS